MGLISTSHHSQDGPHGWVVVIYTKWGQLLGTYCLFISMIQVRVLLHITQMLVVVVYLSQGTFKQKLKYHRCS